MKRKISEIKQFLHHRVIFPLINLLQEGVTPRALALAVTLGFVFGIFPIIGTTTILCDVVAVIFRLNMAAIQLINYLVYPIQLLLFIPYLKLGSLVFKSQHLISLHILVELTGFKDIISNLKELYLVFFGALLVWFIFAFTSGFIIFRLLYRFFKRKMILEKTIHSKW